MDAHEFSHLARGRHLASVAAFTDATSPRTIEVTMPACPLPIAHKRDVGRLQHRVGRFDHAHESAGLDHAKCVAGNRFVSSDVRTLTAFGAIGMVIGQLGS